MSDPRKVRSLPWLTTREDPYRPPTRSPLFSFGRRLRDKHGQVGRVTQAYADFDAVAASNSVGKGEDWWRIQTIPPSTRDQVFYSILSEDGKGESIVGERDAEDLEA